MLDLQATSDPSITSSQVDILRSCIRINIFSFELMEAQQKQQPACRPDQIIYDLSILCSASDSQQLVRRDQDIQNIGSGPRDSLDTSSLTDELSCIKMSSQNGEENFTFHPYP